MIILTLRTDNPNTEIGLYDDEKKLEYRTWELNRTLADQIHTRINEVLVAQKMELVNIDGIIFYEGPGSFTGLRIGASVANALGHGVDARVVSAGGESWIQNGGKRLQTGESSGAVPKYGAEARTTTPKK